MARVILLTGGNRGEIKDRLQQAQRLINERVGAVLHCSHRYVTEAWGFSSAEKFSNQALEVSTDLSPEQVLDTIQSIEEELGRDRAAEAAERQSTGQRYCSRPIDIDILLYDDLVLQTDRLTIPHPLLAEREYALTPLCELMRNRRHPLLDRTIGELLEELKADKK